MRPAATQACGPCFRGLAKGWAKFAALAFVVTVSAQTHAQGCAQCVDQMQATPPFVQRAYRHSIELLAVSGLSVFAGGILLLRRYR